MPRKITSKRKGKSRRTLRRNRKQKGGDDDNSNNTQIVNGRSELSTVMASLPSKKIFPRIIDNKLQEAFKRSKIDDAWRTLVTKKQPSDSLKNIINHIEMEYGEEDSDMYDPEILYLLLISKAWMVSFVKENSGYERARQKFIQQTSDVGDAGDLYSVIAKNIEQFLDTLIHPKIPTEYNELMKHIWDNPHLVLSVASYVFDIAPSNQNNTSRENENQNDTRVEDDLFHTPQRPYVPTADEENNAQFRSIVQNLRFGGGRKKRTSRNKGKRRSKKKTLKRRKRKSK